MLPLPVAVRATGWTKSHSTAGPIRASISFSANIIIPVFPLALDQPINWMPLDIKPPVEHCGFSVTFQLLKMAGAYILENLTA